MPETFKKDEKAQKELNEMVSKNKTTLFESFTKSEIDLNQTIKIDNNMKKFIDVINPNNQINADVEIVLNTVVTSLYETSTVNGKQEILSTDKISDLLALSGINFAKEYDKLMKGEQVGEKPSATLNFKDLNNLSLSLRGGGGC